MKRLLIGFALLVANALLFLLIALLVVFAPVVAIVLLVVALCWVAGGEWKSNV